MRLLPIASGVAAVTLVGLGAWWWLRESAMLDGGDRTRRVASRSVDTPAVARPTSASGAALADALQPKRAVASLPDVDVHGWFVVSRPGGETQRLEQGRVVLASRPESHAAVHVELTVKNGTFDTRLPGDAIVEVAELELGGEPVTTAAQVFDLAQSQFLEVFGVWSPPIALHVVDAASGLDLRDVQLADLHGRSIRDRVLPRDDGRAPFDSPLVLSPVPAVPFETGRAETMCVGAAGHATLEVAVEVGKTEPSVVALPLAARLVVALTPWPPDPKSISGDAPITVALHRRLAPSEQSPAGFRERVEPRSAIERSRRRPDGDGKVTYDDLDDGTWLVTAEFATSSSEAIVLAESLVEATATITTTTTLRLEPRGLAPATVRFAAHDARTGVAVAMTSEDLRFSRLDGQPIETRALSVPTTAGTIEVEAQVLGERAWATVHRVVELLPGTNVVELELTPTSAVAVDFAVANGADVDSAQTKDRVKERMSIPSSLLEMGFELRDGQGRAQSWRTRGDKIWWLVEAGRYELTVPVERNGGVEPVVVRTLEVAAETTVRDSLTSEDFGRAIR